MDKIPKLLNYLSTTSFKAGSILSYHEDTGFAVLMNNRIHYFNMSSVKEMKFPPEAAQDTISLLSHKATRFEWGLGTEIS